MRAGQPPRTVRSARSIMVHPRLCGVYSDRITVVATVLGSSHRAGWGSSTARSLSITRVHPRLGGAVASVPTGLLLAPLPALLPLLRRRRLPTPHLPSWLLLLLLPWLLEPAVPAALYCAVPLTAPLPPPAMLDLLRPALRFGRRVRWRPMRLPRLLLPLLLPAASSLLVSPTPLVSLALLPLPQRRAGGAPCDLRIDLHCRSSFWITGGFLPAAAGWSPPGP